MLYDRYVFLCKKAGLSPSAAAVKAGINKGTISVWKKKWEKGIDVDPDRETIDKLKVLFDVNSAYLLGMTDNASPASDILALSAEDNGMYDALAVIKDEESIKKDTTVSGDVSELSDLQREAWNMLRNMDDDALRAFITLARRKIEK